MFQLKFSQRNTNGFSTIELLIAMTIVVGALAAIILVVFGSQSLLVDGQTNSEAIHKAQEMLEAAQALSRKDFKLVVPVPQVADDIYQKKLDVVTQSDNLTKNVTATVTWQTEHGRSHSVTLSSLVTNFNNAIGGDTCNSVITGNWATPTTANVLLGNLVSDSSGSYPITSIDVYQKKMYVAVNGTAQSVGPNNPAAGSDSAAVGTLAWTSPTSTFSSNNTYATRVMSGTSITHYLKANNFGFSVPTGATILGIKVEVERSRTGGTTGEVRDSQVKIVKADGSTGTQNKADTVTNWPTTDAYATYGSFSDLWGETTWKPQDINNSNFGVVVAATGSTSTTNRTANVDHIRITVTYVRAFYILDTTTPTNPTFVSGLGSNTVGTGFNAVAVAGNYAYVATNSGPASGQFQVIDISQPIPTVVGSLTVPGVTGTGTQALGQSLFYRDGYVYLGLTKTASGPEFNIIDVHTPTAPTLVSGGTYAVGSGVGSIAVKGQYAYLGTDDNTREVVIVDISNPLSPHLAGTYNASGTAGFGYGKKIYTVGDSLYFGRTYVSNAAELYVLNASDPSVTLPDPPLATSDLGPNSSNAYSVNGIIVKDTIAFALTGNNSNGQLNILQFNKTATPWTATALISALNLPNSGAGTSMDCEGDYIFTASVPAGGVFANRGSISIFSAP